jgi:thiamine biosynthesis lipoprotein
MRPMPQRSNSAPGRPCHTPSKALELDRPAGRARKHAPLQLDLCGIAKGYAVDRMAAVLQQHGVRHAWWRWMASCAPWAARPAARPGPWRWSSPTPRRAVHGVIELEDLAVATSGDYRHYLQVGDARLAHTMDARRARP